MSGFHGILPQWFPGVGRKTIVSRHAALTQCWRKSVLMRPTPETSEVLSARYGPRYHIYVTVIALLGTISAVVTTTTVTVALPDIMGAFGIGQDRVSG